MITRNKHINLISLSSIGSVIRIVIVLVCLGMFISPSKVKAQVVNNQNAVISVTSGTVVVGDTVENTVGTIQNQGTIELTGHYINFGTTQGNGFFDISGNWINTGIYNPGSSIVRLRGVGNQYITSGGAPFYHLILNNSGVGANRIFLSDDVTVSDTLDFTSGIVNTGINKLYLSDQTSSSLKYLSSNGSRVIGLFERGVGFQDSYLFPIGSDANYNPLNLDLNDVPTAGSILSEFVSTDPDTLGLWLPDAGYPDAADSVEVWDTDSLGYWSLAAANGFAITDYDINMIGNGFRTPYQDITRILKRSAVVDSPWELDGTHFDLTADSISYRLNLVDGISPIGQHYGWGWCRPRIQKQPEDTAVCDGASAAFSVVASGRQTLTYEWQVLEGSGGWQTLSDDAIYSGTNNDTLFISSTNLSMDGYKYRVIIRDHYGNAKHSNAQATLTVNPIPVATATPALDTLCNNSTTHIVLTSDVIGTTFDVQVLYSGSIIGAIPTVDGDTIKDVLSNPTNFYDSVIYLITPTGPNTTYCEGYADTAIIWVNPTPHIFVEVPDTIVCDSSTFTISVDSVTQKTTGILKYHFDVTYPAGVTGNFIDGDYFIGDIEETLINTTDSVQRVTYYFDAFIERADGTSDCNNGLDTTITIYVNPTPDFTVSVADPIVCDSTILTLTMTDLLGTVLADKVYDLSAVQSGGLLGISANGQYNIPDDVIDTLINTTNEPQWVTYTFLYRLNDSRYGGIPFCDHGIDTSITIYVNPTPRLFASVFDDTICNDTRVYITLTTPTVLTSGNVTFDYTSIVDPGLSGNTSSTGLTHGSVIQDSLHNATAWPALPQDVTYTISPRALSVGCVNGPVATAVVTVHPTPDTYFDVANTEDSVTCFLDSDGYAQIMAQNGVGIFTYEWDDPANQTAQQATGLSEGIYIVTITDNQGCTTADTITIHQPDLLIANIDSIHNVTCYGDRNGYASAAPFGGNGGYTYLWSNGDTTFEIVDVSGNVYEVTVTDYKGCNADTSFIIHDPPPALVSAVGTDPSCNGVLDGWVEASGTVSNYLWNTGDTTRRVENLGPGEYFVTATNANGCEATGDVTLGEPDPLIAVLDPATVSCEGSDDGTIELTVSGGNGDYRYSWSTGDTIQNLANLTGDWYYVTITDKRLCSFNDSAYVGEPAPFLLTLDKHDVYCFGESNGIITLDVTGGNGGYSYLWSNNETTQDISELGPGDYYVTVTDSKDCEIYGDTTILEAVKMETVFSSTDVSCYGLNDGELSVVITGGEPDYRISWSNGESGDSIFNLIPDTYTVTVIDEFDCTISEEFAIVEPDSIHNDVEVHQISCFGDNNGMISITTTGGVSPYTYDWSHDQSIDVGELDQLQPGDYTITVLDVNNCQTSINRIITQPDRIQSTISSVDITCFGYADGMISATIEGGIPDYQFSWSNGSDNLSQSYLDRGDYTLFVTDQNNCEYDTTITIIEPDILAINPVYQPALCPDVPDGNIELNITGGYGEYSIYWTADLIGENVYNVRSGRYEVNVLDENLCRIDTIIFLPSVRDICFTIPSAFSPNGDGINERWVIDMGDLYPNVTIEVFNRWGDRIFYSEGYDESQYWDGTMKGVELPMDSYYYVIYLRNGRERLSGSVTILR